MAEAIRVNLGCGPAYKAGYLNIDRFDRSAADMLADVSSLPCKSDSIDVIEASQLLEHFDLVHLRYVLAEWLRVLKPGGTLVIETPDLPRSFRKLMRSRNEQRRTTLQWIYGIDSPGLQHKSGYAFEHLEQELKLAGYSDVVREKELTHTYEPGMRVTCRKREDSAEKMFLAAFRGRLIKALGTQDSFVLIPLENWLEKPRPVLNELSNKRRLQQLISNLAPCNAKVPVALLDELDSFAVLSERDVSQERMVLNELVDMRFHERAFELWVRSRKGLDVEREFASFISRMSALVLDCLENPESRKKRLGYLETLPPRPIALFDLVIVLQESQKSFSMGIKAFSKKNLDEAKERFAESIRINPRNPLAALNLARLAVISGADADVVANYYREAGILSREVGLRRMVKDELRHFSEGKVDVDKMTPISTM